MDLDNIDCPSYVSFSSESFQESLNNKDTSLSSMEEQSSSFDLMEQSNQNSLIEGSLLPLEESCSEENFEVHHRVTRSKTPNLEKKSTIPKPFKFKTDSRIKKLNIEPSTEAKEFQSQLRQHRTANSSTLEVTKVKPFNLTQSKKRKLDNYLPLAEQINAIQKKTPERYHSSLQKEFQPPEHWSPPVLRARSPNLQAVKRTRVIENVLTREEQELEEIKNYEFHAKPVDPRVYKPDVIKISEKKSTKAAEIRLHTSQRVKKNSQSSSPEKIYTFHARPVSKSILAGPTGLGKKPVILQTVPKPPKFTTDERLKKRRIMEEEKPKKTPTKKIAKKQTPVIPKPIKPKLTEIQPFSFDKADKERFLNKKEKILEEIEKETKPYIFKAQLLPSPSVSGLPTKKTKPSTEPKPFNFCLDQRQFKKDFSIEEENVSFKAQPASVLYKEPFIPEKLPKSSVEFHDFNLHTDRRASERLKLKEIKEIEHFRKEQLLREQKALEEEIEREETQKLRQELVHKANPIRLFKKVELKRNIKPTTVAISPKFETDKRLRSKK